MRADGRPDGNRVVNRAGIARLRGLPQERDAVFAPAGVEGQNRIARIDGAGLDQLNQRVARTVAADPEGIDIRSYDVVGIYSPSEVKVLIEQFGDELPTIAAFGEATLRCAIEAGLTVKIKAPTPEAPSMVKAIDIYIDQVHAGKEVEAAQFVEDKQKEEFIRSQQHKLAKKSSARRSSADKK